MLDELLANLKKSGKDTLEGKDIFKLYDTYGFPVELTEELAEDEGFKIDHEGFKAAMKEQQERARASVVKGGSMGMQNETLANITEPSEFLYEAETAESRLSVIVLMMLVMIVLTLVKHFLVFEKHHSTLKWVDK